MDKTISEQELEAIIDEVFGEKNTVWISIGSNTQTCLTKEKYRKILQRQIERERKEKESYLGGQAPALHFNFTKPYELDGIAYDSLRAYEKAADRKGLVLGSKEEIQRVAKQNKIDRAIAREKREDEQRLKDIHEVVNDFDLRNKL